MKRITDLRTILLTITLMLVLTACDTAFQNNPHGAYYINQLTPSANIPTIPTTQTTPTPHLSPFGLGASLPAIVAQYGQPTKYTAPPLYAFQDGNNTWPKGSLIIVTMKNDQAVEFSYVPGTDHPMTYQEAQDFAVKLLPDDAQGPKTVQKEDDPSGKCLAKTYHSDLLKQIFPANDFITPDGKDQDLGSVTVNFFPDANTGFDGQYTQTIPSGSNSITSTNQVNSILVNLGSRISC